MIQSVLMGPVLLIESTFSHQKHFIYQFIVENEAKAIVMLPMDFISHIDRGNNETTMMLLSTYSFNILLLSAYYVPGITLLLHNLQVLQSFYSCYLIKNEH